VHSIEELAAMARSQLSGQGQGFGGPPQQGFDAEPQQGPRPGYAQEPRSGYLPGRAGGWQGPAPIRTSSDGDFGDDLAGLAMGAAARFLGGAISRRMQRTVTDRVVPAMMAKREEMLKQQIAIAERHPGLRACLTDMVIFLDGGSRVLPMPNLMTVTVEQSDALVAQLQNG
jgi:hypothetical protein